MEFKLYQSYSHKFCLYAVTNNPETIGEVITVNPKYDVVTEIDNEDYIILHKPNKKDTTYMKVGDYIKNNQFVHEVGHCFTQFFEFQGGTVEIVPKHLVRKG